VKIRGGAGAREFQTRLEFKLYLKKLIG
jgi:hypothetical protein